MGFVEFPSRVIEVELLLANSTPATPVPAPFSGAESARVAPPVTEIAPEVRMVTPVPCRTACEPIVIDPFT